MLMELIIELKNEIEKITRVDAGELGEINIYKAQINFSKIYFKDICPKLQ